MNASGSLQNAPRTKKDTFIGKAMEAARRPSKFFSAVLISLVVSLVTIPLWWGKFQI